MSQEELQRFEAELQRLAPAQPPEQFIARLSALASPQASLAEPRPKPVLWSEPHSGAMGASPTERAGSLVQVATAPESGALQLVREILGTQWLKLLVPAGALAAALVVVLRVVPSQTIKPAVSPSTESGVLKADDVQIDHELVSTF